LDYYADGDFSKYESIKQIDYNTYSTVMICRKEKESIDQRVESLIKAEKKK